MAKKPVSHDRPAGKTEIVQTPGGPVENGEGNTSLPDSEPLKPRLSLGGEDDHLLMSDDEAKADRDLTMARAMGYTTWRIMMHPDKLVNGGINTYDRAIGRIVKHGFTPYLNITQEGVRWKDASYYRWVGKIARHVHGLLEDTPVIIEPGGNEDNYKGWLIPKPGKNLEETAGELFAAGYTAIRNNYPSARIVCCDLSSKPLKEHGRKIKTTEFFHGMMTEAHEELNRPHSSYPSPHGSQKKKKKKFELYLAAFHGYQMTTPPNKPSRVSREQGIGSWDQIEEAIDAEWRAGRIAGLDVETRPPSGQTEIGYQTDTRGIANKPGTSKTTKMRIMPNERTRGVYYERVVKKGCDEEQMIVNIIYGFAAPWIQYTAEWDTSLLDQAGSPRLSAVYIQRAARANQDCVIIPKNSLSLPELIAGQPFQLF